MTTRLKTEEMSEIGNISYPKYNTNKAWEMVEGAFSLFDNDNSGCFKKTEFLNFLTRIITDLGGEKPTLQDIEDIMWELDKNGDGQISKKEILVLFKMVIDILGTMPQKSKDHRRKRVSLN